VFKKLARKDFDDDLIIFESDALSKKYRPSVTLNVALPSLVVQTQATADGRRGHSSSRARTLFICLFNSLFSFAEYEVLAGVAKCVTTSPAQGSSVDEIHICIYIYIHTHTHIYIYIHI
jgi:hypothetical protein